jgi:hypothetical protein
MESRFSRGLAQVGAYLLILAVAVLGLQVERHNDQQLCESGKDNRHALRNLAVAVDSLGRTLVLEGKPRSKASAEEAAALAALDDFRERQVHLLNEPVC